MANSETSENSNRKVFSLTLARLHEHIHITMISKSLDNLIPNYISNFACHSSAQIPLCQNNILAFLGRSHSFFLPLAFTDVVPDH